MIGDVTVEPHTIAVAVVVGVLLTILSYVKYIRLGFHGLVHLWNYWQDVRQNFARMKEVKQLREEREKRWEANRSNPGCSQAEIDRFAYWHAVSLPGDYVRFLTKHGRGDGNLWPNATYLLEDLGRLQEYAAWVLETAGQTAPNGSFAFMMQKGGLIYFLAEDGVYCYCNEKRRVERTHDSFTAFLRATTGRVLETNTELTPKGSTS